MQPILKFLQLLCIASILAGCKLAVIVVEGGEVLSDVSGSCSAGSVCIVEVNDMDFQDAFEPVPNAGWYFDSWNGGQRFLCGGSLNPVCILSLHEYKGNTAIKDIVESSEVFYLMPVFKELQPDLIVADQSSVKVNDREWLQPADFVGYSYSQVNDVCPAGRCSGSLPGSNIDLTGYYWATGQDVHLLFHEYRKVGRPVSGDFRLTTTDMYIDYILYAMLGDAPYADEIFPDSVEHRLYVAAIIGDGEDASSESREIVQFSEEPGLASTIVGAWFWRPLD